MSTTSLDILVRASDQATGVLKSVSEQGKVMGTSLSSSASKGTSALNTTGKATSTFGDKLKKIGKTIGVVFAAAAVFSFAKKSVAAYEAVEKQQKLLEVGLKAIDQAAQMPQFIGALDAVSKRTVTLQASTDQVAAAVLNVGHNYFQSLGSEAPKVVAGLTEGILNISAATHKSLGMLQRSLTLSVINTPDKAIGILQKMGVTTAAQSEEFKKLAASGDLVSLTQQEVNAITNAYPGAAGNSATAGEKLAKSMDDIKIKIGRVLVPIVGVIAKVADWAAQNTGLVAVLLGGAGLLYALSKIEKLITSVSSGVGALALRLKTMALAAWEGVTGLVADTVAAVAFTASMGVAAVATLGLGDALTLLGTGPVMVALGAALAAGLAIGTMLDHVTGASKFLAKQIVPDDPRNSPAGINAQAAAVTGLIDKWKSGSITADAFSTGIAGINSQYGSGLVASTLMTNATAGVADAAFSATHKLVKFAGMGKKAFATWAKGVKDSSATSIVSLGGVELATNKTAHAFLKSSNLMARVARQDAAGMKKLASSSQQWVPSAYKEWLINQGPGAVANFEKLTSKAQHTAVGDWKSAAAGADSYSSSIDSLKPHNIDLATSSADKLSGALDNLHNKSPLAIDIFLNVHSKKIPGHAFGGDISHDEVALVGERGPELVFLPGGSHVVPHGQSASRSLGGRGGSGTPLAVSVSIDRRRWVREADYEVAYRGF